MKLFTADVFIQGWLKITNKKRFFSGTMMVGLSRLFLLYVDLRMGGGVTYRKYENI